MTTLTEQNIATHCKDLGISREKLIEFTIPSGVTTIQSNTFQKCSSLESIIIPNSVTTIGESAFAYCTSLKSIDMPMGVTSIARWTFLDCKALPSVTIPNSVKSIQYAAFGECRSLTSITIPDSVTTIDTYAFARCTYLKFVNLSKNLKEIQNFSFQDCLSLTSITIPDSVTTIGMHAFRNTPSLTHIICNRPDLFNDGNIDHIEQRQFFPFIDYLRQNHHGLLEAIEPIGFDLNNISCKELNLICKLAQENYYPDWKTIATSFQKRSVYQIRSILYYFNKTTCMRNTDNALFRQKEDNTFTTLEHFSMFLTPKDNAYLSGTAKNIIFKTKEQKQNQRAYFASG